MDKKHYQNMVNLKMQCSDSLKQQPALKLGMWLHVLLL